MTRQPLESERWFCALMVALLLTIAVMALTAGCESQPKSDPDSLGQAQGASDRLDENHRQLRDILESIRERHQ